MEKWELLSSKLALDSKWFKVRQDTVKLPNGKILDDYYVWLQGDIALVVALTPAQEFILVKQYKHGVGDIIIEHTGGFIEKGEDNKEAAKRELEEETGYVADNLSLIAVLDDCPGKVVGKTYVFLATNVEQKTEQKFDENEDIEVMLVPKEKMVEMIYSGKITATISIAATFLALEKIQSVSNPL